MWKPPEDKAALREAHGPGPDTFVIGVNAANNDAIRKAAPEMMLAFAKFDAAHPDSVLALHTGVHCDGGQDLEALAENLGITDKCMVVDQYRYTAGLMSERTCADWYGVHRRAAGHHVRGGFRAAHRGGHGVRGSGDHDAVLEHGGTEPGRAPGGRVAFWNGVHKGWWISPSVSGMVAALEQAYEQRGDVDPVKLREASQPTRSAAVAEQHMRPVVDELLARMAAGEKQGCDPG